VRAPLEKPKLGELPFIIEKNDKITEAIFNHPSELLDELQD